MTRASPADDARHNAARNDLRGPAAERESPTHATDPFARHVRCDVHLRRRGRRPPRLVRRAARQSDSRHRARGVRRARQGRHPARQRGWYGSRPRPIARIASPRRVAVPTASPAARPSARRDVTRSETEMEDRRDPKKSVMHGERFRVARFVRTRRVRKRSAPLPLVPALSTDPVVRVFLASRFSNTPPPQLPRRTWR